MGLTMSRPWKHPRTGIYWLRKRVPADLIPVLGRREEKRSLKTRDPAEAKRLHLKALSELEAKWAALRTEAPQPASPAPIRPTTLTEREAHQRAEWLYGFWLRKYRDNPSEQTFWRTDLYDRLWLWYGPPFPRPDLLNGIGLSSRTGAQIRDDLDIHALETWCLKEADLLLDARDLVVDEASRLKLAKALAAAAQRASLTLARWAKGEFDDLQERELGRGAVDRERTARAGVRSPVTFEPAFPRCLRLALTVGVNSTKIIRTIWAMTGASNGSDVG